MVLGDDSAIGARVLIRYTLGESYLREAIDWRNVHAFELIGAACMKHVAICDQKTAFSYGAKSTPISIAR